MARPKLLPVVLLLIGGGAVAYRVFGPHEDALVLTGIVTTDDVVVSALVTGQLEKVMVKEGDAVERGQIVALLSQGELAADRAFFEHSAKGAAGQIEEGEAALRYQERLTEQQIRQAEANLAAGLAQQAESAATLTNAGANLKRIESLSHSGASPAQELDQARTAFSVAKAHAEAVDQQLEAQRAAVALAKANAEQIAIRRGALGAAKAQQAAATAQMEKASVRLSYTEIKAPVSGVVDVRAARTGEVVSPGQPILTIIDPEDLWVRADVEETYVERVRLGDHLKVRLPSGEVREATVVHRGVDAGFATQRDVSRTKRDIKTFELRLRVDNKDRHLAVGMTAYVLLPFAS